jgi:molecular chaperone GrpE
MADDPTHGSEAPEVMAADDEPSENHYELNLDEHGPADIDEAFKDAVAAVDRVKDGEGGDAPPGRRAAGRRPRQAPAGGSLPADDAVAEAAGLRERLMRTLADFDNYRKRTDREKQSLRRFANFDVFKDFLGVLDNLERAMDSSGSTEDLKQGLRMIIRQQEEILRRHGVEPVEAVGKPFDPTVHEAVAREETAEVATPTVTREMQRGYLLHDRLLRPAMVFVAMPGGGSAGGESADEGEEGDGEASS